MYCMLFIVYCSLLFHHDIVRENKHDLFHYSKGQFAMYATNCKPNHLSTQIVTSRVVALGYENVLGKS